MTANASIKREAHRSEKELSNISEEEEKNDNDDIIYIYDFDEPEETYMIGTRRHGEKDDDVNVLLRFLRATTNLPKIIKTKKSMYQYHCVIYISFLTLHSSRCHCEQ